MGIIVLIKTAGRGTPATTEISGLTQLQYNHTKHINLKQKLS